MSSQGSAYARFARALEQGNLRRIQLAAAELPHVRLEDALRICLIMRDDPRYDRAATRWLGRLALEARHASLEDIEEAATALRLLPQRPEWAMEQLAELCLRLGVR